jgi:tetratricopeptide (TPR) repeat protein
MHRFGAVLCLLALSLTRCATIEKGSATEKSPGTPAPSATPPRTPNQDKSADSATPSNVPDASHLSAAELTTWNDPAFKQQYAASYIAETEIEPPVTAIEREQMQDVLELISSDKMGEAAAWLEKNRGEAASAVFDFTLGNIYFQEEKLGKATEAYEIAVQKYPKFRRAWRNLGLSYIRESAFTKALPALTRVVELGGGDAITYGLLGFAYTSVDNHTAAESA